MAHPGKIKGLTYREAMQPLKVECADCGGEAWILPFPQPTGTCVCGKCTFGQTNMTLPDMLLYLFGKEV
jgi:hypothetical protein